MQVRILPTEQKQNLIKIRTMAAEQLIVDKEIFLQLLNGQRQDVRQKICSSKEACLILGTNHNGLMELCRDPKTKIKKTITKGKYSLDSIYKEAERLIVK